MVALIPCRAGSKRIPGKNTRILAGHPVVVYAIASAQQSGIFAAVIVCTDDPAAAVIAESMGAWVWERDPVPDDQPDIVWVRDALRWCQTTKIGRPETFAILRPTSPFRTAETIQRAHRQLMAIAETADSIRAVEPATQHPGKMWSWDGPGMPITPLLTYKRSDGVPWHSSPTQSLPTFYVQNSSLEMGWSANVEVHGTIHGRKVAPFFTHGFEGVALDWPEDWTRAEALVTAGAADLPEVPLAPETAAPETSGRADSGRAVDVGTRLRKSLLAPLSRSRSH
jgi:CMP-N,N'-diacetyllegionaminic acid synthase